MYDELGMPIDAGDRRGLAVPGPPDATGRGQARDLAQARWASLQDVEGADRALLPLATALADAHRTLGDVQAMAAYDDQRLQLAEGLGDRDALAQRRWDLPSACPPSAPRRPVWPCS